jgi:HEAT repeat protein
MSFLRSVFHRNTPDVSSLRARQDVDGLIAALEHPNASIRRAAAEALGEMGDARAKTSLHLALEDDDPTVRVAAQAALGRLVKD